MCACSDDRSNGYLASVGSLAARRAIARRASTASRTVDESDVVIASGASGALELAISALVNEGEPRCI
jgi:tyrosine aminotransferase